MIKIGVIGTGSMGRNHVRNIAELSNFYEFVGFHDKIEANINFVKEKYGIPFYENCDELIDQVDAVVLAVPSSLHTQYGMKVMEKGKHALIEKPIALDEAEGKMLCKKFKEQGTVLMVGHVERFNPAVIEMKKVLEDEEIIAIDARRCSPFDPRISDTNVVFDLMIHDLDIVLNYIYPQGVKSLEARAVNVKSNNNLSDYVQALIQFDTGVIATVLASKITEDKIRTIDVHTKHSLVKADLLNKTLYITRKTLMQTESMQNATYKQETLVEKVMLPNVEPLKAELTEFANAIMQNRAALTSGEDAVNALHFAQQINEIAGECPSLKL